LGYRHQIQEPGAYSAGKAVVDTNISIGDLSVIPC
jgi:hypothetical protein